MKDRFVDLLKKLPSFKKKDYQAALKETFIKIDEMLQSPQGKKDIMQYRSKDE